jgi:hypothetical protein
MSKPLKDDMVITRDFTRATIVSVPPAFQSIPGRVGGIIERVISDLEVEVATGGVGRISPEAVDKLEKLTKVVKQLGEHLEAEVRRDELRAAKAAARLASMSRDELDATLRAMGYVRVEDADADE